MPPPIEQPKEMPMEAPQPEAGAPMAEDCVPLDALAMPDEGEQMQPPAVGDKVDYSVSGVVTRIKGKDAYVRKQTVNGQDVKADEAPAMPEPDTEESLNAAATSQDAAQPRY